MKKYEKYKNSGVAWLGEIPEHWEVESFKNILIERNEKNNPIKSTEILSLSIDKGVTLYAEKTTNLDRFKDDFTQYKLAYKGDLVFNSMNMIVGAVGVSDYFGCVSPVYYTYHGGLNNSYTSKFYEYLFRCKTVQGVLYSLGKGLIAIDRGEGKYNTLRLKVSRDDLRSLKLPFPNLSEQTAIVNFLDDKTAKIDQAIAIKQKQIELLKERRQILIHKAVTRGLNPIVKLKDSGVEWIEEIPEHWKLSPLRHLGKTQNGISKGGESFGTGYPFVSYGDVYKDVKLPELVNGLVESTIEDRKQYSVLEGDILFTRTSETVEEIGFSSTCLQTIENATFAGFLIRFRPQKNKLHKEFSKYYFSSSTHRAFFVKEMNLVIRASLSQDLLKRMPVLLPPLSEQEEIGNYLNYATTKIATAISLKEQEIGKLKEYKMSLIDGVVTGKVRAS
jgi:type I restriction enzyme S subunit